MLGAALPAATTNTTLTVNSTVTIGASGATATGTAQLSGIGNGTFSGSLPLTEIANAATSGKATATFTITLSGSTITGTLSIPGGLLLGTSTSGTASATITGGTGSYADATGSFPTLSGTMSGSLPSINLSFSGSGTITTGGGGGTTTPTPTVSAVLDAASYSKNIAQGSIFVVKGSNLSASGLKQFQFPLPTSDSGVKITFTPAAGGPGTDVYLVYLYNQGGVNQLAAILPSTVATGNYNVTVTSSGATSAPFAVAVVQRKPV